MNFVEAIKSGFSNYVNFSGRAGRSEYWFWVLFAVIVVAIGKIIDAIMFGNASGLSPITSILELAIFLPGLGVTVRRLHDIDRTGWWLLISLTIIGAFFLIYWYCQPGTPGPNRFGPNPLPSQ